MNARRRNAHEGGYTLVELIVALTILAMITGALTATFLTATNANANVSTRLHQSSDAQLIAGYWTADAQAAGGTNPDTGTKDTNLGVSTTDDGDCGTGGADLVARFKWREWASRNDATTKDTYTTRVANYVYRSAAHELERRTCADGASSGIVTLATRVQSAPTVQCVAAADCPGLPDQVSITVTELTDRSAPTPYSFTLTASLRAVGMTAPSGDSAASTPLLALGSSTCSGSTTGLSVSGNQTVNVNGQVVVDATDRGGCYAMLANGQITYTAGGTSILAGGTCSGGGCPDYTTNPIKIGDPYAYLDPPTGTCSGTNRSPVGGHYSPGTYPQALSITSNVPVVFDPGVYVFCNGLSFSAQSNVTANGVLFYVKSGGLTVTGGATLALGAPSSGPYAGLLFWYAPSSPAVSLNGGSNTTNYGGAIYAPNAEVDISGGQSMTIGSIVAKIIVFSGGGSGGTTNILGGDPTKPSGPALTATTSTATLRQVHLSWTTPGYTGTSAITKYQYRADRGTGYGAWTDVPGGLVTSYDDTCGTSDIVATTCDYQVRAVNGSGAGLASNEASAASLADSGAPTVTITAPTNNARTGLSTTITGTAGTAVGDGTTVVVRLYAASNCTGGSTTLNATVSGGTWSVPTGTMAPGAKSVCATQTDWLSNVGSAGPVNFTAGQVTNLTVTNGGTLGRVDKGDAIAVTFGQAMNPSTLCTGWNGTTARSSTTLFVTITNNDPTTVGNDSLTVTDATCAGGLNFGKIDLGSNAWVTASTTFSGNGGNASSVQLDATLTVLTVKLGAGSGAGGVAAQTMTYTPSTAMKDGGGNAMAGSYTFPGLRF
jgi:prepilin-type N-terminal cleavage/methylation domain-containing protein